jgi:excisionase family DNA binding protein
MYDVSMTEPTFDLDALLRGDDEYLTPGQVAELFRVDPKTVTRWGAAGKLSSIRTPGGHRRFRKSDVQTLFLAGLNK